MTEFRTEKDTMGTIEVPADKYWGAQTQRSLQNFRIGNDKMPRPMIYALGVVKRSAAVANNKLGLLDPKLAEAIIAAADEVIAVLNYFVELLRCLKYYLHSIQLFLNILFRQEFHSIPN